MAKIHMVTSRRPHVFDKGSKVRKSIKAAADGVIKPKLIREFNKVVADWKHKPGFQARASFRGQDFNLYVYPTGENKQIWDWVTNGTRPHPIVAVNAPLLLFRTEYSARTRPIGKYGVGTGKSSGPWRAAKAVSHPGTEARQFEKVIAEETQPFVNDAIRSATLRAYGV